MGKGRDTRWIADLNAAKDVPVHVRKIPEGVRGLKRGRPAKAGERHPCGKLKKPASGKPAGIAPALWQRIKTDAVRLVQDARLGSELARLSVFGDLTVVQTAAGFKMAEIYGRYERVVGLHRSARSAAYDMGHGDPDLAEERLSEDEKEVRDERLRRVRNDFHDLQEAVPVYPIHARAMLEALVIEDRPPDATRLPELADLLEHMAKNFGEKWRQRKSGPKPRKQAKALRTAEEAPARKPQVLESPALIGFRAAMATLRPDLADDLVRRAFDLQTVLADRERVRRDKEFRKSGPAGQKAGSK